MERHDIDNELSTTARRICSPPRLPPTSPTSARTEHRG
jgi:hypothetical protein